MQECVNNILMTERSQDFMMHRSSTSPWSNTQQLYPYTLDLLNLDRCQGPVRCVNLPPAACIITTPLVAAEWSQLLQDHPDRLYAGYLVRGIREGFRIGFSRECRCTSAAGNMRSALDNPQPVDEFLQTEVQAGRVVGPFQNPGGVQISRFGVIPKANQPGKWRLILDLSSPRFRSVNDGISSEWCSMHYTTVDNAVEKIVQLGPGTLLAKVDIEHAYRNIPVHPADRPLLGMMWKGGVYIDTVLPFGLRSAPKLFSAVADAVEWIACHQGVSFLLHYLDDYLTMGKANSSECSRNLELLIEVCQRLGLPLKWPKLEGPTAVLAFLGILLDTNRMELRLPQEKLGELKDLISKWLTRKAGRKRELLSLIGKLAHAAKIVVPGRIFLRRMLDTVHKAKHLDHWVHLNQEFKSDLAWWHCFMVAWNGLGMMRSVAANWLPQVTFVTDASGKWGCGACWQRKWIQCEWKGLWTDKCIAVKEMLPIVLAVAMWGHWWRGNQVMVLCDNMAIVNVIASNTSKNGSIMHLLRSLHFIAAYYNINLRASHIQGDLNVTADAISRNFMQVFFEVNPTADRHPTQIPQALWQVLVESEPDWTSKSWRESLSSSLSVASQTAREEATQQANPPICPSAADSTCGPYQHQSSSSFCFQQTSHRDWRPRRLGPTYPQ